MKPELYEQFLCLKARAKKAEAKVALESFIASFTTIEERRAWVSHFLQAGDYGHKIRHELYGNLVFPVLLNSYSRGEFWGTLWFAKTISNVYGNKSLHAQVDFKSQTQFFREAHNLQPCEETRKLLLKDSVTWFRYCQHEWPFGILYGCDQATQPELREILRDLAEARALDIDHEYDDFFDDFEAKVRSQMPLDS